MKSFALAVFLAASAAFAQSTVNNATPVQQTASKADALTVQNASGTAQQTITIPAVQGMRVYVAFISSTAQATTAPVASSITTTTTGISGTPSLVCGLTATAGISCDKTLQPAIPMVAPTGTAVTVVSNAAITNVTFTVSIGYYYAP